MSMSQCISYTLCTLQMKILQPDLTATPCGRHVVYGTIVHFDVSDYTAIDGNFCMLWQVGTILIAASQPFFFAKGHFTMFVRYTGFFSVLIQMECTQFGVSFVINIIF